MIREPPDRINAVSCPGRSCDGAQLEPANSRLTSVRHGAAGGDVLEEVVTFVVHEDEGGDVFDFDAPDGFHAELGEFDDFDFADAFPGEDVLGGFTSFAGRPGRFRAGARPLLRRRRCRAVPC